MTEFQEDQYVLVKARVVDQKAELRMVRFSNGSVAIVNVDQLRNDDEETHLQIGPDDRVQVIGDGH